MEEEVFALLNGNSSSGCLLAALTVLSWLKHAGPHSIPASIRKLMLAALTKPKADRTKEGKLKFYTELTPLYNQAHGAAANFLNQAILCRKLLMSCLLPFPFPSRLGSVLLVS